MKVAVIGSNGQLGADICAYFADKSELVGLTHQDIEITETDSVRQVLASIKPDAVINTAAYHNVPECEQNPGLSFGVNGLGALNLAKVGQDLKYKLVHYSTDYVFDGLKNKPYIETDCPNPLNIYALTKLDGERLIQNYYDRYFVVRISGIYGKTPCRAKGGNFINTMIKAAASKPVVKVVNDEILSPTPVSEIAKNTFDLIQTDAFNLYHMASREECSWYEFAKVIFKELKLETPLEPCGIADFPSPVKRPVYSALQNENLHKIDLNNMSHWKTALKKYLKGLKV